MSDVWTRARQSALLLRRRLLGDDTAGIPGAEGVLAAALTDAALTVHLRPPGDSLLAGSHAVLDRESDAVWVRRDLPAAARAALIAHELAHYHLHPEYTTSGEYEGATEEDAESASFLIGYGPQERRETEANVFARELLLPVSAARREFYERGRTAPEIAAAFGVSQSLVFRQLQAEPVAAPLSPAPDVPEPLPLDDSQREAATAARGPLLLGAGPGTGKTRTLVARVRYLLETGVAPENILALTFSRKATAELRERMAKHLPHGVASRVSVCTFHAFGYDLLRRYHRAAGLPPRPVLLSQAETFALMEDRIAGDVGEALWFPHDPTFPLRDSLQVIGRLKEEMVTPGEAAARADATGDPKQRAVAAIYARYERTLRENQALDSADLVCRAVALLAGDENVRRREQERWRHVLVDEYQDVNRAGARLVRLLGGADAAGVWCVGDLRQAIYRFRGASPANVTRFTDDFPGGVRKDLVVNYRSRQPLVSCFGRVANADAALWAASRADASADDAPCVTLAVADTETAQTAGIVREVLRLRQSEAGYRWRDFAVLCRTNPQAKAIRSALSAGGIPVTGGADTLGWLRDAAVRELLLLLSLTVESYAGLAERTGRVLPPYLAAKQSPADFFCAALYGPLGIARTLTDPRPVQTLLALAQTFNDQSALLVGAGENSAEAFLRHVRRVARLRQEPRQNGEEAAGEGADAVQVLTVHAAKGLEFPVVFVPNLSQGRFPPQARPAVVDDADALALMGDASQDDADEEARLFFVAMTRARDHLFLSLAEKYDNRAAQPSSLLAPLGAIPEVVHVRWTPDNSQAPTPGELPEPSSVGETASTPVPAHELERYLRCPRRYYYESRCGYGDTRERTAYDALKRAVRSVLRGVSSEAAFVEARREYELSDADPWLSAYRREWETVLAALAAARPLAPATPYRFELAGGTVEVRADGIAEDGAVERVTFSKSKETGRSDAANTLLFSAVPDGTPVRVRHVRTGEERLIEPAKHASTRRARETHLSHYERALRGIRLNVFPADPEDTDDCADCAYLLICGD